MSVIPALQRLRQEHCQPEQQCVSNK
ncbi:mCG147966 [Mus musculus]|nr:mCG147966 [Mus musculus]